MRRKNGKRKIKRKSSIKKEEIDERKTKKRNGEIASVKKPGIKSKKKNAMKPPPPSNVTINEKVKWIVNAKGLFIIRHSSKILRRRYWKGEKE